MSRTTKTLAGVLGAALIGSVFVGTGFAGRRGWGKEHRAQGPRAELIFEVAKQLVARGDESVVALARLAKAKIYFKEQKDVKKALAELDALEAETQDPQVRVVTSALKIAAMEKGMLPAQDRLASLDAMIASAKERLGR